MKIPNNTLETFRIELNNFTDEKQKVSSKSQVSIKRLAVSKEDIELNYEVEDTNRLINRFGEDRFCLVNFSKDVDGPYMEKVLKHGIIINRRMYSFFGHSSSQIKER